MSSKQLRHHWLVVATAALALASAPLPGASAYGWPVKPFEAQHPIRGGFNDPRFGVRSRAFHFGVDVCAPDGSPVYAVAAGVVYLEAPFPQTVEVAAGARQVFGYWHVVPAVRNRQFVAQHQLLGYVAIGWGHVHFDESIDGRYVDPLAAGRLEPYVDHVAPVISGILFERAGRRIDPLALPTSVDVVVDAFDAGDLHPRAPWQDAVTTPAKLELRLVNAGRALTRWRTVLDLGKTMLPAREFWSVYARGTRQNVPSHAGRYLLYAAHNFDPRAVSGGTAIQIKAIDERGNTTIATQAFAIAGTPLRAGDDTSFAKDGEADPKIDGGAGSDTATIDSGLDTVTNVETIHTSAARKR